MKYVNTSQWMPVPKHNVSCYEFYTNKIGAYTCVSKNTRDQRSFN